MDVVTSNGAAGFDLVPFLLPKMGRPRYTRHVMPEQLSWLDYPFSFPSPSPFLSLLVYLRAQNAVQS